MSGDFDPARMLEVLVRHRVDFVVVGGFAAWIHGAPVLTVDLDLVFEPGVDNVRRLLGALQELDATYRDPTGRRLEPDASKLASTIGGGHHVLETSAGNLDVLREAGGFDFSGLVASSIELEIEGTPARFASLPQVIEMKRRAGRPKDLVALPVLNAVLEDEED